METEVKKMFKKKFLTDKLVSIMYDSERRC